ncbi:MAG TPA: DegV family protein [Anaerolineaceae bacterium]|nr:DegV family protein [Anaerolineaceae bacterium]
MSSVCILTDNTAQFTKGLFPGRDLVTCINLQILGDLAPEESQEQMAKSLPPSVRNGTAPKLAIPTAEDYRQMFLRLGQDYNEVVAICHSSYLSRAYENVLEAAESVRGRVSVQPIDSQTTSVGLGFLVQAAAEAAANDSPSTEIERLLRGLIPHIYSIFCIPSLTYLHQAGFLGQAQALVGEMLGLLPLFSLEDGHLTPLEKVRNSRQLLDFLQEFLDEFSDLYQIAVIQSIPPMTHEAKTLKEHAATNFPKTPFTEVTISLPLATLFGPRSMGVFAIEIPDSRE